ncbi:hypothetical protein [Micromonospora aurantiaca (nom. illeg.)]|uniref:hypothetical protein n=1 Tax=Micromonospora aurantiaca (nom. illeg.) TaxID=47850 RepID=UPI0034104A8B
MTNPNSADAPTPLPLNLSLRRTLDARLTELDEHVADGDVDLAARSLEMLATTAARIARQIRGDAAPAPAQQPTDHGPDADVVTIDEVRTLAQGLLDIAELAMPDTYFTSDSRCQLARTVLARAVPAAQQG